jgi:hypothetical protein
MDIRTWIARLSSIELRREDGQTMMGPKIANVFTYVGSQL